jgi:hypothetical protein
LTNLRSQQKKSKKKIGRKLQRSDLQYCRVCHSNSQIVRFIEQQNYYRSVVDLEIIVHIFTELYAISERRPKV